MLSLARVRQDGNHKDDATFLLFGIDPAVRLLVWQRRDRMILKRVNRQLTRSQTRGAKCRVLGRVAKPIAQPATSRAVVDSHKAVRSKQIR